MTQKKTTKPDRVEITLDRDMTLAGAQKKKGDKVAVSKATADWIAKLPNPAPEKAE